MRHSIRYIFILSLLSTLLISACDPADGPTNVMEKKYGIQDITVDPQSLDFTKEDGFRDTLITFQITANSNLPEEYQLIAKLASARDRSELAVDTLHNDEITPSLYTGSITQEIATYSYKNLILYVYPLSPGNVAGNRSETTIKVRGFDTGSPEVLEIQHPDEVIIPAEGEPEKTFAITAIVSHSVSIDFIDRVQLQISNGIDFSSEMLDDHPDFDNQPGDGIYIQGFSISSDNSPASYSIEVHARDFAGTLSDTLRSTLVISR